MTTLTPCIHNATPSFVAVPVTGTCTDAAITAKAMQGAFVERVTRVSACATVEYRILSAAMASSPFLDALLFVPLFLQYEYVVKADEAILEEAKEICFNIYRSVGICATMSGTGSFPRFFNEFKLAFNKLISFLMKGDRLSHEEVVTILSTGLPASM